MKYAKKCKHVRMADRTNELTKEMKGIKIIENHELVTEKLRA